MIRNGLALLYATLPPMLFVLILAIAMLGTSKFLQTYDIRVVRRASTEQQIKFARTPIIALGQQRYAILGVKFHPDPRLRSVIARNLRTNQIMTARAGQTIFRTLLVARINANQITFSEGSQTVIVGLPASSNPQRHSWQRG